MGKDRRKFGLSKTIRICNLKDSGEPLCVTERVNETSNEIFDYAVPIGCVLWLMKAVFEQSNGDDRKRIDSRTRRHRVQSQKDAWRRQMDFLADTYRAWNSHGAPPSPDIDPKNPQWQIKVVDVFGELMDLSVATSA
jgi:hypothetical protein